MRGDLHIHQWYGMSAQAGCYICGPCDPPVRLTPGISVVFYETEDGGQFTICPDCVYALDRDVSRDLWERIRREMKAISDRSKGRECVHCAREAVAWDVRAMAAYKLRY